MLSTQLLALEDFVTLSQGASAYFHAILQLRYERILGYEGKELTLHRVG